MSEYTTPITTAFELQRTTFEQGKQMFERSIDLHRNMNRAFIENMDSREDTQRRGVELSRTVLHTYLDTVESTVPGLADSVDEIRTSVDEQYDALFEIHAESFETTEEEMENSAETYDEVVEQYLEMLTSQTEILLAAHEDMETQTTNVFDRLGGQMEELQSEMEAQAEQFQQRFEEQAEQIETLQGSNETGAA